MSDQKVLVARERFSNRCNVILGAALGAYLGLQVAENSAMIGGLDFVIILVSVLGAFMAANLAIDSFYTEEFRNSVLGFALAGGLCTTTFWVAPKYGFDAEILGAIFFVWGMVFLVEAWLYTRAVDKSAKQ